MIGDLGDTIHIQLKKQHLDLKRSNQQIADLAGNQIYYLVAVNKFSGARILTGPDVSINPLFHAECSHYCIFSWERILSVDGCCCCVDFHDRITLERLELSS